MVCPESLLDLLIRPTGWLCNRVAKIVQNASNRELLHNVTSVVLFPSHRTIIISRARIGIVDNWIAFLKGHCLSPRLRSYIILQQKYRLEYRASMKRAQCAAKTLSFSKISNQKTSRRYRLLPFSPTCGSLSQKVDSRISLLTSHYVQSCAKGPNLSAHEPKISLQINATKYNTRIARYTENT